MKWFFLVLGMSWMIVAIVVGFGFYELDRFLATISSIGTAMLFIFAFAKLA